MADDTFPRPHLLLTNTAAPERYKPVGGGSSPTIPTQDRQAHGTFLLNQLNDLKRNAKSLLNEQKEAHISKEGLGIKIQFEGFQKSQLLFEKLERNRAGIELLNLTYDEGNDKTSATVFVPEGKLSEFEKLIKEYLTKNTLKGNPKNQPLIDSIAAIREAVFEALWTDSNEVLPKSNEEVWWEIWLNRIDREEPVLEEFGRIAGMLGLVFSSRKHLAFPNRIIINVKGTKEQITRSSRLLNCVAEIRRAKETAEFFTGLSRSEQNEWVQDLAGRTRFPEKDCPYVCILDTGINRAHPLLSPALDSSDIHTIDPNWESHDEAGHGTEQAGLSLYGNLSECLLETGEVRVRHRLESVKLLRKNGGNEGKEFGTLTVDAVSQPEVLQPQRNRVFSMAVTAKDNRDRGRPSSWSSAIDKITSDAENAGYSKRLMILSGGNVKDFHDWLRHPESNAVEGIHDPAQAWNALTVGAYTNLTEISEDMGNYEAIAPAGDISPFSTTSLTWNHDFPLKPDVVCEGGNAARDGNFASNAGSLSLLTTSHQVTSSYFTTTWATSAANALCSRIAAEIMANYPNYWPETVRGMIVHSAEWTKQMRERFLPAKPNAKPKKDLYKKLLRCCGFGVPNLSRALWSASNSLTLIVQDEIQPFFLVGKGEPKYCDIHIHKIPWPEAVLRELGGTEVEMRVTLSYFIEPNPSARGGKGRYSYQSHGLRFDTKRSAEGLAGFRGRINQIVREEEEGVQSNAKADESWELGIDLRGRGSLHSDRWRGDAVKLAEMGVIAVFPTSGWWKALKKQESYNRKARYSLIVSITTPETDIYTPVLTQIQIPVAIQ